MTTAVKPAGPRKTPRQGKDYAPAVPGRTFVGDGAGGWREATPRETFQAQVACDWAAQGLEAPPEIMRKAAQEYDEWAREQARKNRRGQAGTRGTALDMAA